VKGQSNHLRHRTTTAGRAKGRPAAPSSPGVTWEEEGGCRKARMPEIIEEQQGQSGPETPARHLPPYGRCHGPGPASIMPPPTHGGVSRLSDLTKTTSSGPVTTGTSDHRARDPRFHRHRAETKCITYGTVDATLNQASTSDGGSGAVSRTAITRPTRGHGSLSPFFGQRPRWQRSNNAGGYTAGHHAPNPRANHPQLSTRQTITHGHPWDHVARPTASPPRLHARSITYGSGHADAGPGPAMSALETGSQKMRYGKPVWAPATFAYGGRPTPRPASINGRAATR